MAPRCWTVRVVGGSVYPVHQLRDPAPGLGDVAIIIAEKKDDLRTRNADVAKRLVDITGWGHARIQGEMNRLAGVSKVSTATVDQLDRRLRYSESWLRRLKRE